MKLIRLQDNTPDVYTGESRDFQLFCRLYDCVNNGFLYDADTMTDIINTSMCRSNMLPLLQTKIGFFNNTTELDSRSIRMILLAYPILIKNKGSLKAIKYAVNVFFKIIGVDKSYSISIDSKDHRIIIDIESELIDTTILEMIISSIIPAGVTLTINNVTSFDSVIDKNMLSDSIKILFIGDRYNSMLRGSQPVNRPEGEPGDPINTNNIEGFGTRVGAVDSMEVSHPGEDGYNKEPQIEVYPTPNQNNV